MFRRYDVEEAVRAKSSTQARVRPIGISKCRRETSMTNSSGEMGEHCGVQRETGANILGEPW